MSKMIEVDINDVDEIISRGSDHYYVLKSSPTPCSSIDDRPKLAAPYRTQQKLLLRRNEHLQKEEREKKRKTQQSELLLQPHQQRLPYRQRQKLASPSLTSVSIDGKSSTIPMQIGGCQNQKITSPYIFKNETPLENPTRYHIEQSLAQNSNPEIISHSQGVKRGLFGPKVQQVPYDASVSISSELSSGISSAAASYTSDISLICGSNIGPDSPIIKSESTDSHQHCKENKDKQKKKNHTDVEKRRRDVINTNIDVISTLLPKENEPHYGKIHDVRSYRGDTLIASVAYMKLLKSDAEELIEEKIKREKSEQRTRNYFVRIMELENKLQQNGIPVEHTSMDGNLFSPVSVSLDNFTTSNLKPTSITQIPSTSTPVVEFPVTPSTTTSISLPTNDQDFIIGDESSLEFLNEKQFLEILGDLYDSPISDDLSRTPSLCQSISEDFDKMDIE